MYQGMRAVHRGSDKGLSSVSTLFNSLYTLLQRKHSRTEADRLVRICHGAMYATGVATEVILEAA